MLSKYKHNTSCIYLTNCSISGSLDFSNYKLCNTIKLSNNMITDLFNLPEGLLYLDCRNNKINELILPNSILTVLCDPNVTITYY
jgi:hypothetical protein